MNERSIDHLWGELTKLIQWAYHDGYAEDDKEVWEWDVPQFKDVWGRITDPSNVEIIKAKRGTAMNPDWNRIFDEAYRQALERYEKR